MPLPAALAAKLAKRGLVKVDEPQPKTKKGKVEEEVFAENYDEPGSGETAEDKEDADDAPEDDAKEEENKDDEEDENSDLVYETSACPNIDNEFHECVDFCKERWGSKKFEHSTELEKKYERLMRRHPLPEGWMEVGDPTMNRYYYWHMDTDQVSWMPPSHPKSKLSLSANKLKEALEEKTSKLTVLPQTIGAVGSTPTEEERDIDDDFEEMERELLNEKKKKEKEKEKERERDREKRGRGRDRDRDRGRDKDRKRGGGRDKDELDPMDPAAYSDIARGSWAMGLEKQATAKTGVDSTASGPLFQQRPYPSPGAVLRANKAAEEQHKDKS